MNNSINDTRKFLLSITGNTVQDCKNKLQEIQQRKIDETALFFQHLSFDQRQEVYNALAKTDVKKVPLVHIGASFNKNELDFLFKNYQTRYFTIHESDFNVLSQWKGFYQYLFLEMSTDNVVANNVEVEKIGGFCVDLAHYQKQKDRDTVDYHYVYDRRNNKNLFQCNHLSGYSFSEMEDLHYAESVKDFDYIKVLPEFVFSNIIAMEVNNSIAEQMKFREYVKELLI
jgi:hypothetical protein